jgi:hypothetical protein
MEDISQLKLITTSLLQTCSYVTEQMRTPVTIDINKFLESFSITKADGTVIHPPSWIVEEDDTTTFASRIFPPHPHSDSFTAPKPFTMEDYRLMRQAEAIQWINLQEKRASIIARLQPVRPEEYQERRDAVMTDSGPLHRKGMKLYIFMANITLKILQHKKEQSRKFKTPKLKARPQKHGNIPWIFSVNVSIFNHSFDHAILIINIDFRNKTQTTRYESHQQVSG